ncbi:MAG TPA: helix-turn-helix domain-containing protein [Pseudomonas sabulinigri]|uniref:HTH cro/C1-type domain-containing protein n=1 Tax=marine sediment metagenome TaxID=412755 RepID=A0A0F9SCQ3_9ZZZZ|nr:helix-turn-helix domain-containing protein [Halopseudomonas sabulinigri]HEC50304.1 helix-turn-helix domain-containing protein [Halopseudomonas sabulinigri]
MSSERHDATATMAEQQRTSNPGETLRAARVERKMSQLEIAQNLKISVAAVEGIENGLYERLPGDTFARGYIRSYARLVGLDPNRLALEFDRFRGIEVRERSVSGISRVAQPRRTGNGLMRWASLLVLLAVIASVVWWYDSSNRESVNAPTDEAGADDGLLDEVEVDALTLPAAIAEQAETLSDEELGLSDGVEGTADAQTQIDESVSAAETAAPAVSTSPAVAPSPAVTNTAGAETAPPAEQSVAGATLNMSFTANCWVQVKALNGTLLHSGLMQAGQSINLSHEGAIDLVIGDRSAVQTISYRGEQINLPQQSQSGVARLRLGQ